MRDEEGAGGRALPSRLVLLLSLATGLFAAWWALFHEVACGGISIRTEVPLFYTYASCYSYTLGCMLGVGALALVRRLHGAGSHVPAAGRVVWLLYGALAAMSVVFYACVMARAYPVSLAMQLLINVAAMPLLVGGIALLARLALSDATFVLLVTLACYVLVDNVLLPTVISAVGEWAALGVVLATIVVALPFVARRLAREEGFGRLVGDELVAEVLAGPTWRAAAGEAAGAASAGSERVPGRKAIGDAAAAPAGPASSRVAWQPLFHLAVYSMLFGATHVEASSLIEYFFARNVPYTAGALLAVGAFWWCFVRASAGTLVWPKIRDVVFPLTVASFLMLPLLDSLQAFLPVALINCAVLFYDATSVLAVLYVARESRLGVAAAAMLGIFVRQAGFLAGTVATHVEIALLPDDVLHASTLSIAAFLLLVAATLWVGDDRRARKLWGMRVDRDPRSQRQSELQARCDLLARRHRLTPKEREVTLLLAQGRRPAQIAELMLVSINTVRTHIRNAYAALDVHSYKELVDLVASVNLEDAYSGE